jgi:hypothetical protein
MFGCWDTQFGLLIGFIRSSLVVTTINYNTVPDLHSLHSLHVSLFSLSAIVFITHSLDHTLQIKPSIRTVSLHTKNSLWLSLKTLSRSLKQSKIHCRILLRKLAPRTVFLFKAKSHCDWRSVSKSWCPAPSGAHDQIFITVWQLWSCFLFGAPSDKKTGLFFVYAAGPCQRSLSRVWVPWYSRPYFTVSDLRLPFPSPPTTRRVTV